MTMKIIVTFITIQLLAAVCYAATAATYTKGQTIKAKTTEGVEMSFTVLDPDARTCAMEYHCIDINTYGKVTVPYSVEGFRVVEANNFAFGSMKNITSVVLPSGLNTLGEYTFSDCESLTEVSLPNGLKELGTNTFQNCKRLKSVTIPSTVTSLKDYVFYRCESLESIKLSSGIDSIGSWAFCGCKSLASIALPSSVRVIDRYAFYNCTSLKTITGIANVEYLGESAFSSTPWQDNLPEGELVYIGKVAYQYKGSMPENTRIDIKEGTTCIAASAISNSNLVAVSIPASVKTIGESAFGSHTGLASITVASANQYYDSRGNCDAIIHSATNTLVTGCNNTVIPPTVKAIGYDAFWGSRIEEANIPDAVDSLAAYAFNSCSSLKSVTIGKGLRKIERNAFGYCYNLEKITVSSANSYFDSRNDCNGVIEKSTNTLVVGCMTTVIPSMVKTIGNYAYCTCSGSSMCSYVIPNQIEKVGTWAFAYISNLRAVTLGPNVKTLETYAFYGCSNLMAIRLLNDMPFDINENVFQLSSDKRDSLYNHATLIVPVGSRVNYLSTAGWNRFRHIVEADPSTLVEGEVFTAPTTEGQMLTYRVTSSSRMTCELIASPTNISGTVTVPEKVNGYSVTAVADEVFYSHNNDRNISTINLPNSVTTIGEYAFYYCKASIASLPASLVSVGNNAFYMCSNLTIGSLPSSLEKIGNWAFGHNEGSSLHIPASVESIGYAAFVSWNNLTHISVDAANKVYASPEGSNAIVKKDTRTLVAGCKTTVIPSDVVTIGGFALYQYRQKESATIVIPESVTAIERYAFAYSGLTQITLPENVKSIGEYAFRSCGNLVSVTVNNATAFAIPDNVFEPGTNQNSPYDYATLYVPEGCKSSYQKTDGWRLFNHIEEMNTVMATLNDVDYQLDDQTQTARVKLIHADHTDVVIPETLTYNGKTYNVTTVADSVFCSDMESFIFSVTFPASIRQVNEKAFWRYNPSAIVWQSDAKIPEHSFDNIFYHGTNFLLYVKNAAVAPSDVENLIVDGKAGEVVLNEYWQFNCPKEFTATKISLTHQYTMTTGISTSAGWETIALPFDVTSVTHATKGRLVPFEAYRNESDGKPFWLYGLSSSGFTKASAIKANTPYIISMPNNDNYSERFNVAGKVTFAATNAIVRRTGDAYQTTPTYNGGTFRPCYAFYQNTDNIFALNVPTDLVPDVGPETPGSMFITGGSMLIYPFGARIEKSGAATRTFSIDFADETDGIQQLPACVDATERVKVYRLSGQFVGEFNRSELAAPSDCLPAGIYVVDGKKVHVK